MDVDYLMAFFILNIWRLTNLADVLISASESFLWHQPPLTSNICSSPLLTSINPVPPSSPSPNPSHHNPFCSFTGASLLSPPILHMGVSDQPAGDSSQQPGCHTHSPTQKNKTRPAFTMTVNLENIHNLSIGSVNTLNYCYYLKTGSSYKCRNMI